MTNKKKKQSGVEVARATVQDIGMSPRKARLVIDLIRGKQVSQLFRYCVSRTRKALDSHASCLSQLYRTLVKVRVQMLIVSG